MPKSGNMANAISNAEHIGPLDTGDNIEAKRVAGYLWNGTGWQRSDVGFANTANITTDISTPGTIIETDGTRTLTTTITDTEITEVWS